MSRLLLLIFSTFAFLGGLFSLIRDPVIAALPYFILWAVLLVGYCVLEALVRIEARLRNLTPKTAPTAKSRAEEPVQHTQRQGDWGG